MKQIQEAYIVAATRTPIGRSHRGAFRNLRPDDLLVHALKAALDTMLTRELEEEGFAREFVSKIQNMRKDTGLEVSDRISIHYNLDNSFKSALINFSSYICAETLAETLAEDEMLDKDNSEALDINGIACFVRMRKNISSSMKKGVEE